MNIYNIERSAMILMSTHYLNSNIIVFINFEPLFYLQMERLIRSCHLIIEKANMTRDKAF